MKKENLVKYMSKIHFDKKNLAEYIDDEKGIRYTVTLGHLMPSLERITATEEELKKLLFEQKVEKGMVFEKIKETRPALKYEETKKEEDKNILIDKEYEVYEFWNVTNALNILKSFNNKQEATKMYENIRKAVIDAME